MNQELPDWILDHERSGSQASLQVEVIGDFACPFSFIGKRRLDAALQSVHGPVDVSWHPYQLNPEIPRDGLPFEAYLAQRFGDRNNVQPVLDYLVAEGEEVGIKFRFDALRTVPNTIVVHQVMQLAETLGKDTSALAEDLFSAFFEHGRNISDSDELTEITGRYNIPRPDLIKAIESEQIRSLVVSREQQVRNGGLAGIPGFLLNRRLLVVGAQEADDLVNGFDRAMFGAGVKDLVSPALH